MTGESLLHYHILEKICEGGMGAVYKALDTRLDRPVAIKVLLSAHEPKRRRQLVWEARAAAKLRHPNIVVVHDVISGGDNDCIVMEYVPGRPLSEVLAQGPLPASDTLRYGIEIASALEEAHNAGIVHRDLKPSNILVTPEGSIKLVDFGLAQLQRQDVGSQTARRVIAGTCGYMSPEQAQGEIATAQSDIFSFGAILYEMATGQRAFGGESAAAVLAAVLRDEPSSVPLQDPRSLAPLEKIIDRCLRKDPKRRFQHMGDVRLAIEDAGRTPKSRRRAHEWMRSLAYAVVAILLMASGRLLFRPSQEIEANSVPIPLTSFPGMETDASWSPDGRQVAFTSNGEKGDNEDIYIAQPGSGATLRLTTDPGFDQDPAWSPDGRWIAYAHYNQDRSQYSLQLVSPLGGQLRTLLTNAAPVGRASWAPDGRSLVVSISPQTNQPEAVWAVSLEADTRQRLTWPPEGSPGDIGPAVSPDGKELAFCRKTAWRTAELYLQDLGPNLSRAGAPRRLTNLGYVADPVWTPDGKRILFEADRDGVGIWAIDHSGKSLRPVFGVPTSASKPAVAKRPDGHTSLIFTNSVGKTTIWRYGTEHGPAAPSLELAPSTQSQSYPQFSNDGKKLAFSSTRNGYQEIWVASADGSQPVQLTDLRHQLTEVGHWAPRDDMIAFVSQDRAFRQLYVIRPTGGPAMPVTHEAGVVAETGWSRDGTACFYDVVVSGVPEIWKVSRSGGQPVRLVVNGRNGIESSRGSFYYWRPGPRRDGVVMRRDSSGDRELALSPPACGGCLAIPASGGFYYKTVQSSALWYYDESTGRSVRILKPLPKRFNQFTISPDGKWFATDFSDGVSVNLMIMENFH